MAILHAQTVGRQDLLYYNHANYHHVHGRSWCQWFSIAVRVKGPVPLRYNRSGVVEVLQTSPTYISKTFRSESPIHDSPSIY